MDATLITVAPTGAESSKERVPHLPTTLDELVATAVDCEQAGAALIHVHLRGPDNLPTLDLGLLREATAALRESTSLIVQLSTGGAVTDPEEHRIRVLDAEPDSASLSCGTVNFGDDVFMNRWQFMVALHQRMQEQRVVPEYELFDLGHVTAMRRLIDRYGPPYGDHIHCDLVMGVPGGMPGTAAALVAAIRELPEGASFSATGVGRTTVTVAMAALAAGGHLRVGMEDTLTFAPGEPVRDNRQLVERAAQLAQLAHRPAMSPAQARAWLGIADRSNAEVGA